MSLFNLIFLGTKSFGVLFLLKKGQLLHNNGFFFLNCLFFKAQSMTTHTWMNGCIQ